MATMNVSLPDELKAWAEQQSNTGRYSNVSDYVRDLIRRDQDQRQAIVEELIAGEKSGESNMSVDSIWKRVKRRHQ